jgi:hypothetical protein
MQRDAVYLQLPKPQVVLDWLQEAADFPWWQADRLGSLFDPED